MLEQLLSKHHDMKYKIVLLLTLILFFSCSVSQGDNTCEKWTGLSEKTEKRICDMYINALDSFAMVMPKIGDDTESYWAADSVHAMATVALNEGCPFGKQLATIYQMQSYTAYGLSYFNAIIGMYHDPDASKLILHFSEDCDSLYNQCEIKSFKDVHTLTSLGNHSLFLLQLFKYLNDVNQTSGNNEVDPHLLGISIYSTQILDSLEKENQYTEKDLFKVAQLLEGACFFQVFCPLAQLFANSRKEYEKYQELFIEAANYFDSNAQPIYKAFSNGEKQRIPDDDEFENFMLKSTMYKVDILRIVTKEIEKQ